MKNRQIAKIDMQLPVNIVKEGKYYVAHTPALDIATSGMTENDAKKNFNEIVGIFFEEFIDTPAALDVVLESLGWTKQKQSWKPPVVTNIIQNVSVNMAV